MRIKLGRHTYQMAKPSPKADDEAHLVVRIAASLNIARPISHSLFGSGVSTLHHMFVGLFLMVVGVLIAKVVGHHPNELVAGAGDLGGYAIHGLGLTPFIEWLGKAFAE